MSDVAQGAGSAGREPETGRQKEECFHTVLAVRKAFVYWAWEGGPGGPSGPSSSGLCGKDDTHRRGALQ